MCVTVKHESPVTVSISLFRLTKSTFEIILDSHVSAFSECLIDPRIAAVNPRPHDVSYKKTSERNTPFVAIIFETRHADETVLDNLILCRLLISLSFKPAAKETANFSRALNRFQREDPTFRVHLDPELKETIIFGMGELH
jgi:hypothetical protein